MFMHRSIVVSYGIALLLVACDDGGGPMRAEVTSGASATPSDEESFESAEAEDGEEEDAGSEADAAPQEPDAVGLPCAVKMVFVEHCQGCHGADAKNGTPLLTRDNLLAD